MVLSSTSLAQLPQQTIFPNVPDWISGAANYTNSVVLGDVDSDGDLDLVCGNGFGYDSDCSCFRGGQTTLYLNEDGVFSVEPAWASEEELITNIVTLGDVDGDGNLDLVCAASNGNDLLYMNEGGSLSHTPVVLSGSQSYELNLGDVDGDGDLDLLTINRGPSMAVYYVLNIYLNNDGIFSQEADFSTYISQHLPTDMQLGDVDKDGDLDVVIGKYSICNLMINEGQMFEDSTISVAGIASCLVLGDINGDGSLDLVTGSDTDYALYLNKWGSFSRTPDWSCETPDNIFDVNLGDVDNDGDLDVVGVTDGENVVFLNQNGMFDTIPAWTSNPKNPTSCAALGDINGNGALDLVCGNRIVWNYQSITLYSNLNYGFLKQVPFGFSLYDPSCARFGDVDDDGDQDLVLGAYGPNKLYLNEGCVLAESPVWYSDSANTRSIDLGDVDGDGDPDLVCGNINTSNMLYMNEQGIFSDSPTWSSDSAYSTSRIELADLDNDGDLDLACANSHSTRGKVIYLNNGNMFSNSPDWISAVPGRSTDIVLRDMNGDGMVDFVATNYDSNQIEIYLGSTELPSTVPAKTIVIDKPKSPRYIACGDIDRDGDIDLVVDGGGIFSGRTIYIYLNENGEYILSQELHENVQSNCGSFSVELGDIDGDSDLDLAVVRTWDSWEESCPQLYINHAGTFSPYRGYDLIERTAGSAVQIGDIEPDGDYDCFIGGSFYINSINQGCLFDLVNPTNQLPNNRVHLSSVDVSPAGSNLYSITCTIMDIESDPAFFVSEFKIAGDATWFPAHIVGYADKVGPLSTSPEGIDHQFTWNATNLPITNENIYLRLKLISNPRKVCLIQRAPFYLKDLGPLTVNKPKIELSTEHLIFNTVTSGDTSRSEISIMNSGNEPLTVYAITFPVANMSIGRQLPIIIDPGSYLSLAIDYITSDPLATEGDILIETNDPINPVSVLHMNARIYAIEFTEANLYQDGILKTYDDLKFSVLMHDSVHVDSMLVHYRAAGAEQFKNLKLDKLYDPSREQFVGDIKAASITSRGIEYYIEACNGAIRVHGDIRRLRKQIDNLSFPYPLSAMNYQMISLPLEVPNNTIIGVLVDDLGAQNSSEWRMFSYTPPHTFYSEIPNEESNAFIQGSAYWLISKNALVLDTSPMEGLSTPTDSMFAVELKPGWNMIGNPFNFPVFWDSCFLSYNSTAPVKIAKQESLSVQPPISWDPDTGYRYDLSALEPFRGYWVNNMNDSSIVLAVPPKEASPDSLEAISKDEKILSIHSDDSDSWLLSLSVSSKQGIDENNIIGYRANADNGWDSNDRSEPPLVPGRALSLYFPHTSWKKNRGYYSIDIRNERVKLPYDKLELLPSEDDVWGNAWSFDVVKNYVNNAAGDEVLIVIAGTEDLPAGSEIYLVDLELGQIIDPGTENQYRFFLDQKEYVTYEEESRFLLIVGSEEFINERKADLPKLPTETLLHQNFPNPFNPSTIIRYDIAEAGNVDLRIYDARGALIKILYNGYREQGRYEAAWNGRSEREEPVASGIYFYHLNAGQNICTRKMVLLR